MTGGVKHDTGKLEYHLLPWKQLAEVVRVLQHGKRKYSEDNWQQVPMGYRRYLNAALRHLAALMHGESHDPESGLHHAAHAACSCLFMLYFAPPKLPSSRRGK